MYYLTKYQSKINLVNRILSFSVILIKIYMYLTSLLVIAGLFFCLSTVLFYDIIDKLPDI